LASHPCYPQPRTPSRCLGTHPIKIAWDLSAVPSPEEQLKAELDAMNKVEQ